MLIKFLQLAFLGSCLYVLIETVLVLLFGTRPRLLSLENLSFCQVKPLYEPGESTLAAVDTFRRQTFDEAHNMYLCSATEAPREWLSSREDIVWLELHSDQSQNGKAATLELGAPFWTGDIFVISDGDMRAKSDYLQSVLQEFIDPQVGVVTCIYTGEFEEFHSLGQLFEVLCMLDFAGSVLVCERTEGISFAMGSTMAIRRQVLEQIGGFKALTPYLADDYQLGNRAHKAGWKVRLARTVMQTQVGDVSLTSAIQHQLRWLVTSKVSRPGGHVAFLLTQGFFWSSMLAFCGDYRFLTAWCALRVSLGLLKTKAMWADRPWLRVWPAVLFPLKDVLYLGLWFTSLVVSKVQWGHRKLSLGRGGIIVHSEVTE